MNNRTPAPWNVAGTFICANNGDRIAYMAEHDEQALADARLIAAAPEMYSLLERLRDALDGDAYLDMHNEIGDLLDMIEVAQNDQ